MCLITYQASPNNAINADAKKLRSASLFASGYGWRYVSELLQVASNNRCIFVLLKGDGRESFI